MSAYADFTDAECDVQLYRLRKRLRKLERGIEAGLLKGAEYQLDCEALRIDIYQLEDELDARRKVAS